MKITIIANDNIVGIDSVFRQVDLLDLPSDIHAVQFDSALGEGEIEFKERTITVSVPDPTKLDPNRMRIEWRRKPNVKITDISPFQLFIDRWNSLTPTPLTVKEIAAQERAAKIIDITRVRDQKLKAGILWNGFIFHTDDVFQSQLQGMILAYDQGVLDPITTPTVAIRTMDNTIQQLTPVQLKQLGGVLLAYVQQVYVESWAAKDALPS